MYDELVQRVRQVAEEVCDDYDVDPYIAEQRSFVIEEAADAIEKLQEDNASLNGTVSNLIEQIAELNKHRWIPVTERLPECEGERVLVAANFLTSYLRASICYFSKNLEDVDKYDFDGEKRSGFYAPGPEYGYYERQCVRYWMPLPQPPEEG